ncbi:MAG TPA: alkaline phosphatase family protein [Rhizomicrobium sp.]|nr:alkaline phosphatase family protein [Rhizomicrobium sp.]
MKKALATIVLALLAGGGAARAALAMEGVPRYDHIFVIIAENKSFARMAAHPEWAPNLTRLAAQYGSATSFYAETHPSEPNYVAMLGGDTFGIRDDDAYYCKQGMKDSFCGRTGRAGYADHSISARSLTDQLSEHQLSWKGYLEDLPAPGSLMPQWPNAEHPAADKPLDLYAAKHNGFINFVSAHDAPERERMAHLVGFEQLYADLASGGLPNYAEIVPNQCNDMHGLSGANVPADCHGTEALVRRGDAEIGMLAGRIMQSPAWGQGNFAIVITFDEDDGAFGGGPQGCCGYDPSSPANFGGGRIMTLVVTNHGPHPIADPTPYNHYSLLRTVEDAFGISEHLRHAGDSDKGVVAMAPLFAPGSREP